MHQLSHLATSLIFALTFIFALPATVYADVRVLVSGGFWAAYSELLPQFEQYTGIKVTTARGASQGAGPSTIGNQLRCGVGADVVILSKDGLAELFADGRIVSGSEVNLASVPLGVGVRAGASRPDVSTVAEFKQALLNAESIGIRSSSGIYLKTKVFPNLGISAALAPKLSDFGVASRDGQIVVLPVSEILPVSGVDFAGTMPDEIQFVQVFVAALVKGVGDPESAKRLIDFLASEAATPAVEKGGMKRTGHR